ncbi:ABC transporter ATP-binding protein [Cryptosporangium sp. NPDC051539]|uniref:ABC transporter ATP-binding protein n=1 Tax=Cryptosporangium sp. NPDC051539 TaxID=3363962 RepID=UPI0037B2C085
MATLALSGLTARYGKVTAIDSLDLTVGDGEFFVILGPSGAGKTTTLKSVAGLVELDAGSVSIGGRSMDGVEPYHRNVAMAFESYALYPQKTVFANLASPLKSGRTGRYSPADIAQRIELVTTTLGIAPLRDRFPRELSNGQRQRVALGRVLVRPADVYLLDEPLSHLDAKLRAAMRAELKNLGAMSHTTTLYVTHDYQEALALGDRLAVLREGMLVQVGTPEQLWRAPADTFVAKALGQPEINLVEGTVSDGELRVLGVSVECPEVAPGPVRVGIRPRDLAVGAGALEFTGRVGLAERLGRLVELTVDVAGTPLIVVTDRAVSEGSSITLHVAPADVHIFAAGSADTARLGGLAVREGVS